MEEIVMALRTRHDTMPYTSNIKTEHITKASRLVSTITGFTVQPNKSIVGANAFAHEAGIHQDGVIKDRRTYEIMRPEDIGVESTLVLGKHSGRHAVKKRCEELGHELSRFDLDRVYRQVIALADRQKSVGDDDLATIVSRVGVDRLDAGAA